MHVHLGKDSKTFGPYDCPSPLAILINSKRRHKLILTILIY